MGTKLYVGNLPFAPSAAALRAHFSACGVVADVQIIPERNSGRGRGSAVVKMGSSLAAERALAELNGAPFAGQLLLVEAAPDDASDHQERRARRSEPTEAAGQARITQQFREPANMTYELDCAGTAVVIRVFFPTATASWRVVAQVSRDGDAPRTAAAAASRREALRELAGACRENADSGALQRLDWDAIERTLAEVRAL